MGFFSGIGKALKKVAKVVSIKNVVNVATGNGGAVVKDLTNRLKEGVGEVIKGASGSVKSDVTKLQNSILNGAVSGSQTAKLPASVQFAIKRKPLVTAQKGILDDLVGYVGGKIDSKVDDIKTKIYQKPEVKGVMDYLKKEAIGYYWQEYKGKIIFVSALIIGLGVWFFKFRKPKRGRR